MPQRGTDPTLVLFNHDFDAIAHARLDADWPIVEGGFDLFAFPSQLRLAWLDLERLALAQAWRARALGCRAVVSHHEQFGALTAALVAERLGWPGTPVQAVLACQHKLHARTVLQEVCPEASVAFSRWSSQHCDLPMPYFVKPIKAAFSVFAREIQCASGLSELHRVSPWDKALIRLLIQPFERVVRKRLPQAGTAVGLMAEAPVRATQFNLDGYVLEGEVRHLGVVDSVMYPGTQAFMRFDYPSRLAESVVRRAVDVARRFLGAIGFDHGTFNMEFFYDEHDDRLTVIEFNPRLASQFSDLYERVDGLNLHELALALAHGRDPAQIPRKTPTARVASSFVYRRFDARRPHPRPAECQREVLHAAYPDALLLEYPKTPAEVRRDLQWLGSCRHGILHLGGQDPLDLQRRCEVASHLLGWTPPYAQYHAEGLNTRPRSPARANASVNQDAQLLP